MERMKYEEYFLSVATDDYENRMFGEYVQSVQDMYEAHKVAKVKKIEYYSNWIQAIKDSISPYIQTFNLETENVYISEFFTKLLFICEKMDEVLEITIPRNGWNQTMNLPIERYFELYLKFLDEVSNIFKWNFL